MNLIYTFDKNINKDDSHKFSIIKSYYINGIKSAKKLGYNIEMYTNCDLFDEYLDVKHNVTDTFLFWDMYKIIPLENSNKGILVDGDILFHNNLPKLDTNVDMYFDEWESWIDDYDKGVKELTEMGLQSVIPEWEYKPQRVINIGVLKINNIELLNKYIDSWYLMHEFCKLHKNNSKYFYIYGTIASQYLLTLISKEYNIKNISNRLGKPNEYYTHFVGKQKYNSGPIPINKSII